MRIIPHLLLVPLVIASAQIAAAQDTAYQALRTLGSARDQSLLERVVEVKGRNGSPQPDTWLIVVDDPKARGGVREVEISKGKIVSERTPVQAYSGSSAGAAMDLSRLNLDSQGAFTVAEEEARAAGVSFDGADYVLRQGDNGSVPQWTLQLLDGNERGVGTIRIAAEDGAIVSRQFRNSNREVADRSEPQDERPARRSTPPPRQQTSVRDDADYDSRDEADYRRPAPPRQPSREARPRSASRSSGGYDTPIRSATGRNSHQSSRSYSERDRKRATTGYDRSSNDPETRPRDIGYRLDRRVHRIGGALQQFFTGRRTVDEKYREPYDFDRDQRGDRD